MISKHQTDTEYRVTILDSSEIQDFQGVPHIYPSTPSRDYLHTESCRVPHLTQSHNLPADEYACLQCNIAWSPTSVPLVMSCTVKKQAQQALRASKVHPPLSTMGIFLSTMVSLLGTIWGGFHGVWGDHRDDRVFNMTRMEK